MTEKQHENKSFKENRSSNIKMLKICFSGTCIRIDGLHGGCPAPGPKTAGL